MEFFVGDIGKSVDVSIVDNSGLVRNGLMAADLVSVKWSKSGGPTQDLILVDLAAEDSPFVIGGWFFRDNGVYRLCLDNAMLSTVDQVRVRMEANNIHLFCPTITVKPNPTVIVEENVIKGG